MADGFDGLADLAGAIGGNGTCDSGHIDGKGVIEGFSLIGI